MARRINEIKNVREDNILKNKTKKKQEKVL